ncbi:MAG TPA: hypothetical protein VK896_00550 [Gaiellaceae bacterium]|nr:hypothetical protein [Gaiellaceae bacterium]
MAERHPDELDLLDLVEGELPRAAQGSVAAHVEGCARCSEVVRQLRAGRGALHSSGVLQLSERARDRISAAIDEEPRARRFRFWEPRRLGLVVAATLVLVASAVAVAQWGGVGDEQGGDAASELAEDDGGGDGAEGGGVEGDAQTVMPESTTDTIRVAGPAREVAAELRAEGFEARVVRGEVVVQLTGERLDEGQAPEEDRLQAVLAERGPGRVTVRVER